MLVFKNYYCSFNGDGYPSSFSGRLAVLFANSDLRIEVFLREPFINKGLNDSFKTSLGNLLIVFICTRSACFGKKRELLPHHAASEFLQAVSFRRTEIGTIVVKLNEVRMGHSFIGGSVFLPFFSLGELLKE